MAQINKIKSQPIKICLNGETKTLKFDMNSFAVLEERFGSVQKAFEALSEGSIKTMRILLWAGLIHDEVVLDEITGEPIKYNITPFEVGSWISPAMMNEVSEKLGLAMNDGMPEQAPSSAELKVAVVQPTTGADGTPMATIKEEQVAEPKNI
jgi:hypothetical protein